MEKRVRITRKMRALIFEKDHGICHLCKLRVDAGQEWEVSHEIPLENGGKDDISNWFVAHYKCHRVHTAKVDIPAIAKTKRIRDKHTGASMSKAPMPFGRKSEWKRKMDGTIVRRKP